MTICRLKDVTNYGFWSILGRCVAEHSFARAVRRINRCCQTLSYMKQCLLMSPQSCVQGLQSTEMARVQQNLLLLVANVLISLGVFIFFTGFFRGPFRTSTDNQLDVSEVHGATRDSAPFDKVVFLMIDALRRFELFFQRCATAPFEPLAVAGHLA